MLLQKVAKGKMFRVLIESSESLVWLSVVWQKEPRAARTAKGCLRSLQCKGHLQKYAFIMFLLQNRLA